MSELAAASTLDRSSPLRFLLIEDSTSDRELVRALLEDEFAHGEIEAAADLEQALVMLTDSHFDLVLADLTLPDADGGAVVRAVRDASPQTALMVLTGRVDGTLALWALAEGAQDYLVKGEHDGPRLGDALLRGVQRSRTEQLTHAALVTALEQESESTRRLRELDRAKNEFVETVSHELRTPLSNITGYAELLQDATTLSPHEAGFVDAIARNAARLTSLADDLVLLLGLSADAEEHVPVAVDLRAVVVRAREMVLAGGTASRLDISFDVTERSAFVSGNPGQLERVVLNLMGNAIKFSEDGGSVVCRVRTTESDVLLDVTDTGIGIPPDERSQLFNRFFRGASAHQRAIPGTGLGLHLVSIIVAGHRGDVTVASEVGEGTTFTVRLPRTVRP
ncbi:sensor histidine kinase [Nocardioides plantarum]|uniref:histidine kinase n=1 Tax=Nocardioides plantarum TaxID=29299 RepID=A0ABV5KGA4_9ACTN|nr:ATP-binding protein [Nocardioides plantarum]